MELIDDILADWRKCQPDGVVLRASRIGDVINCVIERASEPSFPRSAKRQAYDMLRAPAHTEGALPPLVKHLRVDCAYSELQQDGRGGVSAVIHFVYFWQVLQAVYQRLRYELMREDAESPLVEELAGFRDRVLAYHAAKSLSPSCFLQELRSAKTRSQDPAAWSSLECVAENTFARDAAHGKQGPSSGAGSVRLDIVSTLLLAWLGELTEDYCRGEKHVKLKNVRDVLGCSTREANLHLGASGWDLEMALRRYYATQGPTGAALRACHLGGAWSSGSAKLRCKEHECPICVTEFLPTRDSVTTGCCYQVICMECAKQLSDEEGILLCPFCRCLEVRPAEPVSTLRDLTEGRRRPAPEGLMSEVLGEVRRFGMGVAHCLLEIDPDTDAGYAAQRAREIMAFRLSPSQLP